MPETFADYFARAEQERQKSNAGAANVVLGTVTDAPDQVAGDMQLANEFGKVTGGPVPPMPMVKEYRNVFQQKIEESKASTILAKAPTLSQWLQNQDYAAIARDDLENMSWFDGFGTGAANALSRSGTRLSQMGNQLMLNQTAGRALDRKQSFGQILDSEREVISTPRGDQKLTPGIGDVLSATGRWLDAKYADAIGTDDSEAAKQYAAALQANIDKLAATPKSQIATQAQNEMFKPGATFGQSAQNIGAAILSNPIGVLSWALETAGESAPQMAAAIGATAVTKDPRAGIAVMFGGSYATERYTAPADFLAEKGIDLHKPEDVGRVLSDPTLLKEANDRGVIRGLIIGTFDAISGGLAGRVMANNPLVEAFAQSVQQAVSGSLGEYSARVAAGQPIDWGEIFAEGLAEIATAPVDMATAGRTFVKQRSAARAAEGTVKQITDLSAQAQQSKTRMRAPDVFRDYVSKTLENGGNADMYIPADQFVEYFQGSGIDPFELANALDGVTGEDLQAAISSGGDLAIPTATYAAKIAGTEHDQFFAENAKFDPLEMSAREAAEFNANADEALQSAWDEAEAVRQEIEQSHSIETQIYDSMVSRMRDGGNMSTDVATADATLFSSFYQAMASRGGMTTSEMLGRYPLPEIKGAVPEGMQLRNVDDLNRTLAAARNRKQVKDKRETLLDFISNYGGINDVGGELRARNADVIKRPGKASLKLARQGFIAGMRDMIGSSAGGKKHGADDVALAAVEAGFMANDPDVIAYKAAMESGPENPDLTRALYEAIDAQLRGEPQYASDGQPDPAAEQSAQLDQIEEYLNSVGVSLNDSDEVIRQAIDEANKREYAQVSPDQARAIDMTVEMPSDPLFAEAVANTPGAEITADGLLVDLVRFQKEEQSGSTSVRTGVFYLPAGAATAKYYKGGKNSYGGRVEVRGETLIKRPLFSKGATGGKAPETAYDAIKGKGAYEKMRGDVLRVISNKRNIDEAGYNLLEEYGADGNMIWEIVPNSKEGNQLAYALQENIVAHAVREAGYDAVVGYSKGKAGASISEVFDVREIDYPTPGETATLHPNFGLSYNQAQITEPSFQNLIAAAKQRLADRKAMADQISAAGRPVKMENGKLSALVGPNTVESEKPFRVTYLGEDGQPNGHVEAATMRDAAMRALEDGFSPVGSRYAQPAYHGTPHLFEKFSTDAIGTGEGAQAFGWGLYFASKKGIAEEYRKRLAPRMEAFVDGKPARDLSQIEWEVADDMASKGRDVDSYIAFQNEYRGNQIEASIEAGNQSRADTLREILADEIAAAEKLRGKSLEWKGGGRLFEVDVPEDNELLAWDAPLNKQSDDVKSKLMAIPGFKEFAASRVSEDAALLAELTGEAPTTSDLPGMSGGEFYSYLASHLGDFVKVEDGPAGWMAAGDVGATVARVPNDRAASELLRSVGIPGHRFLDGTPRNAGEGTYNYVIYDDSRVNVRQFEQSQRGSIQFPAGGVGRGETIIRTFQSADLSTMLHESGHYFLSVMQDMARRETPVANGIASDYDVVKSWWRENAADVARDANKVVPDVSITADDVIRAIADGTTGDGLKDAAIDVGMQEQWARGFEAYLMEGKAPSIELREVFAKFRSWLISVYKKILARVKEDPSAALDVKISPEIRKVFDRMLAVDEEIAKAQADVGGTSPLFATADDLGLTQPEYEALLKLRAQSEDAAQSKLTREVMEPIRRAEEQKYKDERAAVKDEVTREINAYRYFRAIEWMGNNRWLGDGQPAEMPDIRLSKEILVARYGEGILKTLPRGKQTVYAAEGGIDPDDAAGWFGFDSGDEMVKAMEKAPNRKKAIEDETDRVMHVRHGDVLKDGAIEAAALEAVHTDKRGEWIAAELKAVVEVAGTGRGMTMKEARASAKLTMARMRVRDAMSSNRFLAAERKAAAEAARLGAQISREKIWMDNARLRIASKAKGALRGANEVNDIAPQIEKANANTSGYNELAAKLVDAKRRQLINHSLYMESVKINEEVEKAEAFVAKLSKKTTREKIGLAGRRENAQVDYLGAMDEILDRYDFRKLGPRAEQRRWALNAFIEAMKAAGRENEIAIPDAVLADAARKPYKTVPVEELRGAVDSLKNIQHMAYRWNKLIDAAGEREFDASADAFADAIDKNLPKRPPGRVGSTGENARNSVRQYLDLVLNSTTLLREIDGFEDGGAAYANIKAPIDQAMDRLTVRKEKAAGDLEGLYSVYSKDDRRAMAVRTYQPELGYALSKWEGIAVALNAGNEGNYQRLTDPKVAGHLTDAQVEAVLKTLDKRDAKFVQSVWDYVNTFWPDIAELERRTTGVLPEKVDGSPIVIAGETLKGGYYPLKYDPRLSSLARDDQAQDVAASLMTGRFGKAQTKNGHRKERAQSSGRAVEFDMSVLHRHINQVIYDLELSEPVANSWRLLQDGRVRSAFREAGRNADFDALEIWLKDVAEGEIRSADMAGRMIRTMKSNFTAAKLAFNLSNTAMQITGLAQSFVVVGKKDMAVGIMQGVRRPFEAADDVAAKSSYMASRQTTFNKDIYDFYNDPKAGPIASRWGEIKSQIIGPLSFWLMTKMQWHAVDVPTWLAGYRQGLRRFGNDEAKAIAHADGLVKRAQASGLFSDRSAVERGSVSANARQNDFVRLFTTLGSYMFAKFNVAYERSAKASRIIKDEGVSARSAQEALSWSLDMVFLFTLEAVLIAAIKGRLPSGDDGEDDEGWLKFLARETGFSVMSTLPFIRDGVSVAEGFSGGGAYGGVVEEVVKAAGSAGKVALSPFSEDAEVKRSDIKNIINGTGIAVGAPSTAINRMVDAGMRQAEGDDVSPMEFIVGRMGK